MNPVTIYSQTSAKIVKNYGELCDELHPLWRPHTEFRLKE
jgi:hypothetical protein